MNKGNVYLEAEFPLLDYITECNIVAEDLPYEHATMALSHGIFYT